jgi:hypothetical protein
MVPIRVDTNAMPAKMVADRAGSLELHAGTIRVRKWKKPKMKPIRRSAADARIWSDAPENAPDDDTVPPGVVVITRKKMPIDADTLMPPIE